MSLSDFSLNSDFVTLVVAILVAMFAFSFLVRIVNAAISVLIPVAIILLALQFVFDMSPKQVWYQVSHYVQNLWSSIA